MSTDDTVTLSQREQQRLQVLNEVLAGRWSAQQAAAVLGLSRRHVLRLKAAYGERGAAGLTHANRGRSSQNRVSDELRQRVVSLARGAYAECNASHFRDLLARREGILLSSKSIGRILREAGLPTGKNRRAPRHRSRRERMPQTGMLLQTDGSDHHWFGPDLPATTLLAAIDDATSAVVAAVFRQQEDAQGYFLLVRQVLTTSGVPLDLYHDRHSIFQRNPGTPLSIDEQLRGRADPTQFGQALEELGITSIAARSPQAKGRIERLWGTLQDRLVVELRLAGIIAIAAANAFLPAFLAAHNDQFAVPAEEPGHAYRPLDPAIDLDRVLSFRYSRVVANDNTVQFFGQTLQIPPGPWRRSYARAHVVVHECLDGSLGIWHHDRWLLRTAAAPTDQPIKARRRRPQRPRTAPLVLPPEPAQLTLPTPAQPQATTPRRPAADHPWRRYPLGQPKKSDQ